MNLPQFNSDHILQKEWVVTFCKQSHESLRLGTGLVSNINTSNLARPRGCHVQESFQLSYSIFCEAKIRFVVPGVIDTGQVIR